MSACVSSIQDSREIPSLGIAPASLTKVLVVGGLLLGISLEGGMQVVEVSVGIAGEKWSCSTEILTELPQLPVWHRPLILQGRWSPLPPPPLAAGTWMRTCICFIFQCRIGGLWDWTFFPENRAGAWECEGQGNTLSTRLESCWPHFQSLHGIISQLSPWKTKDWETMAHKDEDCWGGGGVNEEI